MDGWREASRTTMKGREKTDRVDFCFSGDVIHLFGVPNHRFSSDRHRKIDHAAPVRIHVYVIYPNMYRDEYSRKFALPPCADHKSTAVE